MCARARAAARSHCHPAPATADTATANARAQDVETCDLLIVDRGVDPVAPIVHDWSYECLCHDLLALQGNTYKYRYTNNQDKEEERDVQLDDSDKLFRDFKCMHIGDVFNKVTEMRDEFTSKNKAAQARLKQGEKDFTDAKNIARGIEKFQRQLREINLHDTVAGEINKATKARGLTEIGELEQELIFGEKANSKTIKKFLEGKGAGKGASRAQLLSAQLEVVDRLRMLLCYFGTHVEKLDGEESLRECVSEPPRPILPRAALSCASVYRGTVRRHLQCHSLPRLEKRRRRPSHSSIVAAADSAPSLASTPVVQVAIAGRILGGGRERDSQSRTARCGGSSRINHERVRSGSY